MKKCSCKLVAVLLILVMASPAFAINDKAGHFIVGGALGMLGTTPENGFWLSVGVSAIKESVDACGYGTPEWEDFGAGVAGAFLVFLLRQSVGNSIEWRMEF
jgi:hypothetical protein